MELRHLRYFVAIAEDMNMRRAAEKLRISQPPLSRQINDLEAEIGAKLFDRSSRKLKLTNAGEFFLKESREILQRAQRAAALAQAINRGEAGTLVIAYSGPVSGMLPASVMRQCREIYPSMEIVIREMTLHGQVLALLEKQIDLGYVGLKSPELEDVLLFESIRKVEMLIALPSNHPFTKKKKLDLRELADEHFIFTERSSSPMAYDWIVSILMSGGFIPNVTHQSDNPQNLLRLVAAGFGISLVPDMFRNYAMPDIVFRPLRDKVEADWYLAWRRDNHSTLLKTFLGILREKVGPRHNAERNPFSSP